MDKLEVALTALAGVTAFASQKLPEPAANWAYVIAGASLGALVAVFSGKRMGLIEAADSLRGNLAVHFSMGVLLGRFVSDWAKIRFPEPDYDAGGVTMIATGLTSILSVSLFVYIIPAVIPPLISWIRTLIPKRPSDPKP